MAESDLAVAESISYERPNTQALLNLANGKVTLAEGFVIDSASTLDLASEELAAIKDHAKKLGAARKDRVDPLNKVVKLINDDYRQPIELLGQAEAVLKKAMLAYTSEQQRKADEARREAEARAEAERKRLAAEAQEAERLAREAAAQGNQSAAAELQRQAQQASMAAAVVTAPAVHVEQPKASGFSTRGNWVAEVKDIKALMQFVVEHPEHDNAFAVNQSYLNAIAKAQREKAVMPGVEFKNQPIAAQRSR